MGKFDIFWGIVPIVKIVPIVFLVPIFFIVPIVTIATIATIATITPQKTKIRPSKIETEVAKRELKKKKTTISSKNLKKNLQNPHHTSNFA